MRNIWSYVLTLSLIATMYVWSGGGREQDNGEERQVLSILTYKAAPHERAALEDVVARFEAGNLGVTVELETVSHSGGYDQVLDTRLISGEMADIYMEVTHRLRRIIDAGYAAPITGADFIDNYQDSVIELASADGEVYAIPTEVSSVGIWYNRQILADSGIAFPQTWDDFVAAAETLQANGYDPLVMANKAGISAQFLTSPLARDLMYTTFDAQAFIQSVNSGKNGFSEVYLPAFERLAAVTEAEYYDAVDSMGWFIGEEGIAAFSQGNAAFFPGGNWFAALFEDTDPSGNIVMGPNPITLDVAKAAVQPQSYLLMYPGSDNYEPALEFMRFFSQPDVMNAYVAALDGFSPLTAEFVPDNPNPRLEPIGSAIAAGNTVAWHIPNGLAIGSEVPVVREVLQELVLGNVTAAEAAERLDAEITRRIQLAE